ncbi:MAG TPA: HAD family hydrolase [Terriglobales bacterium]|jgi:phosphoglycolate phosphatase|nr:HAD family hydrolase [Terriglobales bacterium]
MQADAYVFDIDGTLLVTRDLVHWNALRRAMLDVYGVDTSIEAIPYHGMTDILILRAALVRAGLSLSEINERLSDALKIIQTDVVTNGSSLVAEACASVPVLLHELEKRGKLLTVASGNLESVGWEKIKAAGLQGYFKFGSFGDILDTRVAIFQQACEQVRDKLGNLARVCFIGDTPNDVLAARAISANVIAVSTGGYSYDELLLSRADLCCHSCAELLGQLS